MFLLVPAYPGCPGQRAETVVCVCMRACVRACVCVCLAELMHLILLADRGNSSAYYVACVHLCVTFVYTVLWMNAILGCNVM